MWSNLASFPFLKSLYISVSTSVFWKPPESQSLAYALKCSTQSPSQTQRTWSCGGGIRGWGPRTSPDSNFQISWGVLNTFQIKICWINVLLSWLFKFKPFLGLGMAHSKVSSEMKDLVARNLQKKGKQEARICSGDQMNPQRLGGNRELSQLLTKAPPPSPGNVLRRTTEEER